MIIFLSIYGILACCYVLLIRYIYIGWVNTSKTSKEINHESISGISVIVAARNESNDILPCIKSILKNDFPNEMYEIIIIDDHSTDNTRQVVEDFANHQVRVYSLPDDMSGKKAAISHGISLARFPLIVCTDADCMVGRDWLIAHHEAYLNDDIKICTGLVLPQTNGTILSSFQWLDFAATMTITANGIYRKSYYLANGANLSYAKDAFMSYNGFDGNMHLASGDDLFLMQKIAGDAPRSIRFLTSKTAMTKTKSEPDWPYLIRQRKRWATKSLHVGDKGLVLIQAFIFIFSLLILTGLIGGFYFSAIIFYGALTALLVKGFTDYLFLNSLAGYFDERKVMRHFLICFLLYFGHILMSGWFALFPMAFEWKERYVR